MVACNAANKVTTFSHRGVFQWKVSHILLSHWNNFGLSMEITPLKHWTLDMSYPRFIGPYCLSTHNWHKWLTFPLNTSTEKLSVLFQQHLYHGAEGECCHIVHWCTTKLLYMCTTKVIHRSVLEFCCTRVRQSGMTLRSVRCTTNFAAH